MANDPDCARAVVEAVGSFSDELWVVMPAGSPAVDWARAAGVRVAPEAFCDRAYLADGTLVPRGGAGSLITDPQQAADRALALAQGRPIDAIDGSPITLDAATLCVHSDSPGAAAIARHVRAALESAGVTVSSFAGPS
jgi:UPF0271 protein